MNLALDNYLVYIYEDEVEYKKMYFRDITEEWLMMADTDIKEVKNAKYVIKNKKRYYVNSTNKIIHKNKEEENARWYVDIMGGTLMYLPIINEDGGISCADYRYYSPHGNKYYYLEEKETNGKSKNTFYHALQSKHKQANIFLIDCTLSHFSDSEIYENLRRVFAYNETQFVNIVIVKNKNKLFGVFEKITKEK